MAEPDPQPVATAIPEVPFVADIISIVNSDLDTTRGLQQRLLAICDAYLATAFTVASLFAGVGFGTEKGWIGLVPVPLVLALWYLDGANWVRFKHASARVRHLEAVVDAYVAAIRERKTARRQTVAALRRELQVYHYDMESSIAAPTEQEIWAMNRTRLRWWLYAGIALALVVAAILWNFA
jgi:hypothetical protein